MLQPKYKILENIRLQRNLSYRELAQEIGLSIPTLFNIITGRTTPFARNQYKIEQWLNGQTIPTQKEKELP